MAVSLIITTLLTVFIFSIAFYLLKFQRLYQKQVIRSVIYGGFSWSFASIFILIPFILIFNSSSNDNYKFVFGTGNLRTPLFWIIALSAVLAEFIRYKTMFFNDNFFKRTLGNAILFGIGWGIGEFITRFLFFFSTYNNVSFGLNILILYYLIVSNCSFSVIMLRCSENTKFFMFTTFLKLITEIGIFGAFGHITNIQNIMLLLFSIALILVILSYLTYLGRIQEQPNPNISQN